MNILHKLMLPATLAVSVAGQTVTVDELLDPSGAPSGTWTVDHLAGGGSATLVSLAAMGGDLHANQPGPDGAVRLTTGFSNDDKASVIFHYDFGDATAVLSDLVVGYSYYKQTVEGGNRFAAPALRLGVEYDGGDGDNLGYLVYEPYWNQPGGGAPAVPADAWQTVSVSSSTGGGNSETTNSNGGWWWDGGFEVSNSSGGPPLRSLDEWVIEFSEADPIDFVNARVVSLEFSIGSYNQGQIGYVDDISFSIMGGGTTTYQFSAVPEPGHTALGAGVVAILGAGWWRRRRVRREA